MRVSAHVACRRRFLLLHAVGRMTSQDAPHPTTSRQISSPSQLQEGSGKGAGGITGGAAERGSGETGVARWAGHTMGGCVAGGKRAWLGSDGGAAAPAAPQEVGRHAPRTGRALWLSGPSMPPQRPSLKPAAGDGGGQGRGVGGEQQGSSTGGPKLRRQLAAPLPARMQARCRLGGSPGLPPQPTSAAKPHVRRCPSGRRPCDPQRARKAVWWLKPTFIMSMNCTKATSESWGPGDASGWLCTVSACRLG